MTLAELVRAPVAWVSALVTFLSGYLWWFDPLLAFVTTNADVWFPAVSVTLTVVNDRLAVIPSDLANNLLIAAALLFVAVLVSRLVDRAVAAFNQRRSN
jgi:hypothetical protein